MHTYKSPLRVKRKKRRRKDGKMFSIPFKWEIFHYGKRKKNVTYFQYFNFIYVIVDLVVMTTNVLLLEVRKSIMFISNYMSPLYMSKDKRISSSEEN